MKYGGICEDFGQKRPHRFRCSFFWNYYFGAISQIQSLPIVKNRLSVLWSRGEADLTIRFTPLVGADADSDFLIKPLEKIEQFIRGETAKVPIH
jgi:hypothetical protein